MTTRRLHALALCASVLFLAPACEKPDEKKTDKKADDKKAGDEKAEAKKAEEERRKRNADLLKGMADQIAAMNGKLSANASFQPRPRNASPTERANESSRSPKTKSPRRSRT